MVVHHVFFWLKDPNSIADRDQVIEGLKTLRNIPSIKELYIGTPAATQQRSVVDSSWQVSELMFFDNLEDEAGYQDHPLHEAFIKNCGPLWSKVLVYDAANVK
jgi:stress responsive alpha/beta barrel protein